MFSFQLCFTDDDFINKRWFIIWYDEISCWFDVQVFKLCIFNLFVYFHPDLKLAHHRVWKRKRRCVCVLYWFILNETIANETILHHRVVIFSCDLHFDWLKRIEFYVSGKVEINHPFSDLFFNVFFDVIRIIVKVPRRVYLTEFFVRLLKLCRQPCA